MLDPTDANWDRVDQLLFEGMRIRAMKAATEDLEISLGEAIDAVGSRWALLVKTAPESFAVPLDGYWDDFYS